jgi:hypothetical protein
LFGKGKKMMLR